MALYIQYFQKNPRRKICQNFIRTNSSPTISPILFARKPGGNFPFRVNYKTFNAIIVKNKYLLPLIQKTLNPLTKTQ